VTPPHVDQNQLIFGGWESLQKKLFRLLAHRARYPQRSAAEGPR